MFRKGITMGINISRRFCHHHSKTIFEPQEKRVFISQTKCKDYDQIKKNSAGIEANTQKLEELKTHVIQLKNNVFYLYLINLYIVPAIVFLK